MVDSPWSMVHGSLAATALKIEDFLADGTCSSIDHGLWIINHQPWLPQHQGKKIF